jgi:hypothetical protein
MSGSKRCLRAGRSAAIALGCVLALAATAADAGPAGPGLAVVTDLSGNGQLLHAGAARQLVVLAPIGLRDAIRLERGATVEIAFLEGTGGVWQLAGPGLFRIAAGSVQTGDITAHLQRRDLAAVWRNARIRTDLAGRASIALRGPAATQVRLRTPMGGVAANAPIVLEWDPPYGGHEGAWQYTVRVIDDQGSLVYTSQEAQDRLTLPPQLPIEPSRDYLWTVQARDAQRRRAYGSAQFHRIADDVQQRIEPLLQAVVQARSDPARAQPSAEEGLLALALEAAGLHDAAQSQLRALAGVRPAWSAALVPPP